MEHLPTILAAAQIVLSLVLIVLLTAKQRPSKRSRRREELASMSVDYAEKMGGEKLAHAIGAFGRLDFADNGKRDYSDAEARIAIEAVLARRTSAK